MSLESKHINLLRSCSNWLRSRGNTAIAKKFGWTTMMNIYADDLEEIAVELDKLNLPKTVVELKDLFPK